MLGFPILYFKGMRLMMFQLYGFYCKGFVCHWLLYVSVLIRVLDFSADPLSVVANF